LVVQVGDLTIGEKDRIGRHQGVAGGGAGRSYRKIRPAAAAQRGQKVDVAEADLPARPA
jgi:hypothetical protein